jgi:hypothetical protein
LTKNPNVENTVSVKLIYIGKIDKGDVKTEKNNFEPQRSIWNDSSLLSDILIKLQRL